LLRFLIGLAFLQRKGKQYPAGSAGPNLKIGNAVLIDFSRKKELSRVIPHKALITELHHGESVVEGFEHRFLSFASKHMPKDKDRLALTLDVEIF
jgi:hypothetical protein